MATNSLAVLSEAEKRNQVADAPKRRGRPRVCTGESHQATTGLPGEVFDYYDDLAKKRGMPLSALLRDILTSIFQRKIVNHPKQPVG
jgi:hypothetical protein